MKRTSKKNILQKEQKKNSPKQKKKVMPASPRKKELEKKARVKLFGKSTIWLLLVAIVLTGFFAFNAFFTLESLYFFKDIGSDSVNQDYPALVHVNKLQEEGFVSKWSFYKGMGQNYYNGFPADPYSMLVRGADYIGTKTIGENYLVYARFFKIFFLNILFSGLLFFAYLRTLSISRYASFIGGFLFAFSGYLVMGSTWGFAGEIFRGVFLLFAFEQFMLKKRWYFLPFAFVFLSGNLFNLYIYAVFLLLYSIFRYYNEFGQELKKFAIFMSKIAALGILGLGMNGINALRGFMKMFYSPRVSGNAGLKAVLDTATENVSDFSLQSSSLFLRLFSNDILGNGSAFKGWHNYLEAPAFYIGLATLLLIPQLFIFLNKKQKITHAIFIGIWAIVSFTPSLRHAFYLFLGNYFRIGLDFIVPTVMLFYAIFALHNIIKHQKINLPLLGVSLASWLVLLFFPYSTLPANAVNPVLQKQIALLLVVLAVVLYFLTDKKNGKIAQYALLALIVFEGGYFAYKTSSERKAFSKAEFESTKFGYADGSRKAVNFLNTNDPTFFRIEKDYQSGNAQHGSLNDGMAQQYFGTTSYSSFNQINYIRFLEEIGLIKKGDETATRWSIGLRGRPILQTFGNVKYNLSNAEKPDFLRLGFDSIATFGKIKVLKNRFALPFGYTYNKFITKEEFNKLSAFNKQLAFLSAFVLEKEYFQGNISPQITAISSKDTSRFVGERFFNFELYKKFTDHLKADSLNITNFSQSKIEGNITLTKPKLLFFTIPFDKGWQISVNGKDKKLSRVNFGFSGIQLPAGKSQIVLKYVPQNYWVGIILSISFNLIFLLILELWYMKKKQSSSNQ